MNIHSRKKNIECNIGYIVKDHVKALMQILTNELPQYHFRLITTKCLNTAIMMAYFLLGNDGLKAADYCDTHATRERHKAGIDNNAILIQDLKKQLFSKREKTRTIYYVMLTDGDFPKEQSSVYFPGHVFILEKIWDDIKSEHYFYFYQSYRNEYTLKEHIEFNKGLKLSFSRAQEIISNIDNILSAETWNMNNVRKWKLFTYANTSNFFGSASKNNFHLCFKKAKSKSCFNVLEKLLKRVYMKIQALPHDEIYGDATLYERPKDALTNGIMKQEIQYILLKLKNYKISQT